MDHVTVAVRAVLRVGRRIDLDVVADPASDPMSFLVNSLTVAVEEDAILEIKQVLEALGELGPLSRVSTPATARDSDGHVR